MDEEQILVFRKRAVKYFERVLLAEGYDHVRATELAFFIAKILEDTRSLLEDVESENADTDAVLDHIHLLYTNAYAFNEGRKVLMYEEE